MIIQTLLTKEQKDRAVELSNHKVYNKSMRGKQANLVGAYGEIMVFDHLTKIGLSPKFVHKTTHDIELGKYKIDVKTKERTVAPQPHYDCTVPAYNHSHQRPDFFIFVSMLSDKTKSQYRFNKGWILGKISYNDLEKSKKMWKAGEVDEDNGWRATIDCYNVPANSLQPVKDS